MRIFLSALLAGALLAGPFDARAAAAIAPAASAEREALNLKVFEAVWGRADRSYYDPAKVGAAWDEAYSSFRPQAAAAADEDGLYRVLNAMLATLDDAHAYATSPTQKRRFDSRMTARPLIGVTVGRVGEATVVEDVRPDSPAAEAGVEIGWRVETADGAPYRIGRDLTAGVPIRVGFRDAAGAARELEITPRVLQPLPEREVKRDLSGAAVIRFDSFDRGASAWLFEQVAALPPGTPVVVDLRRNRGGLIVEVQAALSCFLAPGRTVLESRTRRGREGEHRVRGGCAVTDAPLAVLVGPRSRSGAEVFAAAVQEAGRGRVVGERTAGMVLASITTRLPDGGEFSLSELDLETSSGRRLEKVGVEPDVQAATTLDDRKAGRDPALDAALKLVAPQSLASAAATTASGVMPNSR
ncbi:MAG TPA: S41 family peptidase [Caulobacteraceae bacterium]|nr:S41 family peptidase [Caulobacteraceae bacterium]